LGEAHLKSWVFLLTKKKVITSEFKQAAMVAGLKRSPEKNYSVLKQAVEAGAGDCLRVSHCGDYSSC